MRSIVLPVLMFTALTGGTLPRPGPLDPHIQSVTYNPEEVVELQGAFGWQIMIEFGADERIENVSIGDGLAWQVTPNKRAKMLFLKPLLRNGETNMAVVTSLRRYAFALSTGPRRATTPWIVRFEYPRPIIEALPQLPSPPVNLNFNYVRSGDQSVMPTRVWDDGRQTYFEFAENIPIPAIFEAGPGRRDESLVNVVTRGRIRVVQQTGNQFVLRSGEHSAKVTRASER
jgi:type IV secretion system protein VirB9